MRTWSQINNQQNRASGAELNRAQNTGTQNAWQKKNESEIRDTEELKPEPTQRHHQSRIPDRRNEGHTHTHGEVGH